MTEEDKDMDRQEAIQALLRAGKQRELDEVLEKRGQRAQAVFESIRSDGTRTAEHTRWALAVASAQHLSSLTEELTRMASRVVNTDRDDAERVFGVRGLTGDPASLVISRRDAGDRVAAITERDELRALLARATRSGDEVLARAVAERAVEMQDDTTMNQFIKDRPDLDTASSRLWDAERAGSSARCG
jgi:hypothetical protein